MRAGVRLPGAVVVVTGASSGIGRAAAARFAEKGANVVLAARDSGSLHDAAAECSAAGPGTAIAIPTDVADAEAVKRLIRLTVEEFGRIDVLVNNAAVMAYGEIGKVPEDVARRIIAVNLQGQINAARAVLPYLEEQGSGVIVTVASLYAKMTTPYVNAYATSKHGVFGFSEVLRQELKRYPGIRVSTVLPGSIDTPIFRHAANYSGKQAKPPPPVSSPKRAVRAVVRAAERPKREIVVGRTHLLASWFHTLFPTVYSALAPYAMRMIVLGRGPAPEGEGNVFEPQPELNAVEGGWRNPAKRALLAAALAAAVATRRCRCGREDRPGLRAGIAVRDRTRRGSGVGDWR